MVVPDLEPIIIIDLANSFGTAFNICAGSVESRTVNFFPYVAAITSGAREEPPIPHRTISVKFLLRAQADSASN